MIKSNVGISAHILLAIAEANNLVDQLALSSGYLKTLKFDTHQNVPSPLVASSFISQAFDESDTKVHKEDCSEHGYHIYEVTTSFGADQPYTYDYAANLAGNYIGDPEFAKRLCVDLGIRPVLRTPDSNVCSIGYSVKDGKWYGWSHRAIYGFGIGHVPQNGDCGYETLPKDFTKCSTMEDCRTMASNFAESVSSVTLTDSGIVAVAATVRLKPLKFIWFKHKAAALHLKEIRHNPEHLLTVAKGEIYGLMLNEKSTSANDKYILLHKDELKIPFYLNAAEVKRLVKAYDPQWSKSGRPKIKDKLLTKGTDDLRLIDPELVKRVGQRQPKQTDKTYVGVFPVGAHGIAVANDSATALKKTITSAMKLFAATESKANILVIRKNNPLISRIAQHDGYLELEGEEFERLSKQATKRFVSSYKPAEKRAPSVAQTKRLAELDLIDQAIESLKSARLADKSVPYLSVQRLTDMDSTITLWESTQYNHKYLLAFTKGKMILRHFALGKLSDVGTVTIENLNRLVITEINKTIASLNATEVEIKPSMPKRRKFSLRLLPVKGESEVSVRVRQAMNMIENAVKHFDMVEDDFQVAPSWDQVVANRSQLRKAAIAEMVFVAPRRKISVKLSLVGNDPVVYFGFKQQNNIENAYEQFDLSKSTELKRLSKVLHELPLLDNGQRWYYGSAEQKVPALDTVWHYIPTIEDRAVFRKYGILETDAPLTAEQRYSYKVTDLAEFVHPSDVAGERVSALREYIKKAKIKSLEELRIQTNKHPYFSNLFQKPKVMLELMDKDLETADIADSLFKAKTLKKP